MDLNKADWILFGLTAMLILSGTLLSYFKIPDANQAWTLAGITAGAIIRAMFPSMQK